MNKMKITDIPWLPEISEDFLVGYVKQYFSISKDLSKEGEPERVLKLARTGIVEKDVTTNVGQMAASYVGYNKVQVGDLLLNPMDLYSGANCNVAELNGVISPAYANLRAKAPHTIVPKFYDYYFKSQYWIMAMFAHGKGVSFDNRWTLNNDSLRTYEIPVAPYAVQQRIVECIQADEKKVNILIENVQTQIEKLKAYKQSLITEVVTKGLDPNVPMKDSRVKNMGKIPDFWNIIRLKYLLSHIIDCPHETPVYSSDGEFYVIRTADQDVAKLRSDEAMYRLNKDEYYNRIRRQSLDAEDIVYGREGERWGLACLVPESNKYCLGQRMMQFRCQRDKVLPQFMLYALSSRYVYQQGFEDTMGSTSPHVNISSIRNYFIPIPPVIEQKEIANKLSKKCFQIDRLIDIKQAKIEKLEQYKRSLIYEYVTGKKEVF